MRKVHFIKKNKGIGPIIRNIDSNNVSILLFGKKKKNKHCFVVFHLIEENITIIRLVTKDTFYCGRIELNNLQPDNTYRYLCGIYHSRYNYDPEIDYFNFKHAFYSSFHIPSNSNEYKFVFGSCRFYLNLFGYGIFSSISDKPYKSINKLIDRENIKSLFIIGDSLYMDIVKWLPLRLKSSSSINRNHITARSTKGFKKIASKIEVKEIPDDHEYKDNANERHFIKNSKTYQNCINAINVFEISSAPHSKGSNVKYWDFFKRNDIPIFMMDSRYERYMDGIDKYIMSREQMDRLKYEMNHYKNSNLPFIIFCPVPFILQNGGNDSFSHFKKDQKEIIKFIVENKIKNVFILTGDAHSGICSRFNIYKNGNDTKCHITEIMSSGLYQLSHDKPETFKNSLSIDNYYIESDQTIRSLRKNVIDKDNFCMIEINKDERLLYAKYYKSSGKFIKEYVYNF